MFDASTPPFPKAIPSFSLEALDKLYPKLDALTKLQSELSAKQVLTSEFAFESERLLPVSGVLSAHYDTTAAERKYKFAMESISLGIAAAIAAVVAAVVIALKKFWDWINGTSSHSGGGGGSGGSSSLIEKVENSSQTIKEAEKKHEEMASAIKDCVSATKDNISTAIKDDVVVSMKTTEYDLDDVVERFLATPAGEHSRLRKIMDGTDNDYNLIVHNTAYHKAMVENQHLLKGIDDAMMWLRLNIFYNFENQIKCLKNFNEEDLKDQIRFLKNLAEDLEEKFQKDLSLRIIRNPDFFNDKMAWIREKEKDISPKKQTFREVIDGFGKYYSPYEREFANIAIRVRGCNSTINKLIPDMEEIEQQLKSISLDNVPDEYKEAAAEYVKEIGGSIKLSINLAQRSLTMLSYFIAYVATYTEKIKNISEALKPLAKFIEHEQKELKKQGVKFDPKDEMVIYNGVFTGKTYGT